MRQAPSGLKALGASSSGHHEQISLPHALLTFVKNICWCGVLTGEVPNPIQILLVMGVNSINLNVVYMLSKVLFDLTSLTYD